ncbi:hypothetical protein C8F01DRAFT_703727 [Mycena amicta]|nr:hypothetical protein C8F01DRAFT_703727 [Mycena amicta]
MRHLVVDVLSKVVYHSTRRLGRVKSTDAPMADEDPLTQCASYALEMLSCGRFSTDALGSLVTNESVELWYCDRSIIVRSKSFDFKQDFVAIMRGLAFLNPEQCIHPKLFAGVPVTNKNPKVLPGNIVFKSNEPTGRGICVVRTHLVRTAAAVVLKSSWPAESRMLVAATAVEHATSNDAKYLGKLPEIKYPQGSPQMFLFDLLKDECEQRVLRIVVWEELSPITKLTTAADVAKAFRGIFDCYRWLVEVTKIMHRDISLNNLMFRRRNGQLCGVLNDYDLAVQLDAATQSTSRQRTGTRPFMSMDLLVDGPPPLHVYRFDLESLLHAMIFLTRQYEDGKKIPNPLLEDWYQVDTKSLSEKKLAFLKTTLPPATANFTDLDTLLFDKETLGGYVTFDTFSAQLDSFLPAYV